MTRYTIQYPRWMTAAMLLFGAVFFTFWINLALAAKTDIILKIVFVFLGALVAILYLATLSYQLVTGRSPITFKRHSK